MKHGCPDGNVVKIWQKSLCPTFWPYPTQGHVMSVKCEKPIDELTVQVWLLYHHPNFKYCTLFVSGIELRTDRQTARQTDGQTERTDDPITRCPRWTFQARGIKISAKCVMSVVWLSIGITAKRSIGHAYSIRKPFPMKLRSMNCSLLGT